MRTSPYLAACSKSDASFWRASVYVYVFILPPPIPVSSFPLRPESTCRPVSATVNGILPHTGADKHHMHRGPIHLPTPMIQPIQLRQILQGFASKSQLPATPLRVSP